MANGKRGDHPITDITNWGDEVFGEPVDSMIRELAAAGRLAELYAELDLYSDPARSDLEAKLAAMTARRPSVKVRFSWADTRAAERIARPWGGWIYSASVQFSDPADEATETWSMLFWIDPLQYPDGLMRATARPATDAGPWDKLTPGTQFWMRFAHRTIAEGMVVDPQADRDEMLAR